MIKRFQNQVFLECGSIIKWLQFCLYDHWTQEKSHRILTWYKTREDCKAQFGRAGILEFVCYRNLSQLFSFLMAVVECFKLTSEGACVAEYDKNITTKIDSNLISHGSLYCRIPPFTKSKARLVETSKELSYVWIHVE